MIVNCFAMPGDKERQAVMTVDDDLLVGDVLKSTVDLEMVTGTKRWRVVSLHTSKGEADAVACK